MLIRPYPLYVEQAYQYLPLHLFDPLINFKKKTFQVVEIQKAKLMKPNLSHKQCRYFSVLVFFLFFGLAIFRHTMHCSRSHHRQFWLEDKREKRRKIPFFSFFPFLFSTANTKSTFYRMFISSND